MKNKEQLTGPVEEEMKRRREEIKKNKEFNT